VKRLPENRTELATKPFLPRQFISYYAKGTPMAGMKSAASLAALGLVFTLQAADKISRFKSGTTKNGGRTA
jgi:hypothetical protein